MEPAKVAVFNVRDHAERARHPVRGHHREERELEELEEGVVDRVQDFDPLEDSSGAEHAQELHEPQET
eukprot:30109-Pelagococcus_subviridis.AAC.2